MMTSLTGQRGIGKTYLLAKELYKRSNQNFLCISNFHHLHANIVISEKKELVFEIIRELGIFKKIGYELCDLLPIFKHTGVFFALDEAHLIFGADEWRRYQGDPRFSFIIEFLAQARKQDVEIWWAAQDPAKVDKNWRRYTEDWIRYTAVVPIRRKVLKPHPTRPIMRAEVRYLFPLLREEHHNLDANNPVFNGSMTKDEDGYDRMAKSNTLQWSRFVLSGWMDPFPYKLYDSHEMLAMEADQAMIDFPLLKNVAQIPKVMNRERIPTIKRWMGIMSNEEKIPPRIEFEDIQLPSAADIGPPLDIVTKQEKFLGDLRNFNNEKSDPREKKSRQSKVDKDSSQFAKWQSEHNPL
jgi:hypothetical protein